MKRRGNDAISFDNWAASRATAINAACKSVARDVRGLPQDEAEDRLTDVLRQREVFSPPSELRLLAYQMTDPWRSFRHPLRTRKELRRMAGEPDSAYDHSQAKADEVSARIEGVLDALHTGVRPPSWDFIAEPTFDGPRYELVLHPYSDRLAAQIREALGPIQITITNGES